MDDFHYRQLKVYHVAIEAVIICERVAAGIPRNRFHVLDQLWSASWSVPQNIAEGSGEWRPREKARFYRMARRSAMETAALFDLIERTGLADLEETGDARPVLLQIVRMLTAMTKRLEHRGGNPRA